MPDIAELLEQAAPRPTRDLPFASVQRRGRARTRHRAAAVGCSFAACLLVVAGLTRAVFEPAESESRVTTAASSPDHGEDQADEDVHLDPTQQAQVDEVERLLQDEISPDALTNISASWIRPDGTVVVAFAGPNGAEEARRDPRLAALVAHPAVVLTEQRFTARDLDSVMRRAAEVLNRTVAGAPQRREMGGLGRAG